MRTDDLIQTLTADLRPATPLSFRRDVLQGVVIGAAGALVVLMIGVGGRFDLGRAAHGWPLLLKWVYSAPLCASGSVAAYALSRPASAMPPIGRLALLSVAFVAAAAAYELARAPQALWPVLWLGQSWQSCPARIGLLSIPIFASLIWKMRRAAPTRLRLAGAAAGLASGGAAAALYAFGCAETSASFVLVWYSLGVASSVALGALLGPVLLRW
jgi:hypothetical protein